MKLTSILKAISYVWKSKKIWIKPVSTPVLIYDKVGSQDFADYVDFRKVEIFECRGESINFAVMWAAFIKYGVKINFERYAGQYIVMTRPLVVLTFIDNTLTFYKLKKYLPATKFISIQNGFRDRCLYEVLSEGSKNGEYLEADAICCFGPSIASMYSKYINSKIYSIGSFKNNKIHRSMESRIIPDVLFISQYRTPVWVDGKPTMPIGSRHILWDDFYSTEPLLLPYLQEYCSDNGYKLKVCGTSFNEASEEVDYFHSILGNKDWEYISKTTHLGSYEFLDQAGCVVFIDSTLGYEALGRGVKAVSFPVRGKAYGADDRGFGWPASILSTGLFWSNNVDRQEVERLLGYITSVSDVEWKEDSQNIVKKIMEYDPGNVKFLNILKNNGVELKEINDQCCLH